MQLKRKLALHEKKKLRDPKNLLGSSAVMRVTGGTRGATSKPPLPVSRPSPAHSACSTPPPSTPEVTDGAPLVKSAKEVAEEKNALVLECQKKISATAEKLKGTKAHEEEEQQKITTLTNQLTECVSEIVEHEKVMVRVQQQLAVLRREQEVYAAWEAGLNTSALVDQARTTYFVGDTGMVELLYR